jgi:hypothetical protein
MHANQDAQLSPLPQLELQPQVQILELLSEQIL